MPTTTPEAVIEMDPEDRQNPFDYPPRDLTSNLVRTFLSKLRRSGATTTSSCKIPDLEGLLESDNSESKPSGMEGVMESQFLRERLMGDAIRTGHTFSRVKTVAKKNKKYLIRGRLQKE